MLNNPPLTHQAFTEAFGNILRALRQGADQHEIETQLRNAGGHLVNDKPINLEEVANELKLDYNATIHLLHNKRPQSEIILTAIKEWVDAKKLIAPGLANNK